MFPITVTVHDAAQLNAIMAALGTSSLQPTAVAAPAPKAEKVEKAAKPKAEPKPEAAEGNAAAASSEPATTAAPAASSTASEQPAADAPAPTIADVNAAIIGLAKGKGRDAAVAVLKEFGVAKAPELKPEQYAAVVAAAKKAMA
jgi:hypothetical protein